MTVRRFGPVLGAGVTLTEKSGQKQVIPASLGNTAYVGILERGPVGELITCTGKKSLLAQTGGFIPDSLLPDAAQDFYDHANGRGVLFLYRVTDGNEAKAYTYLWDRSSPRNRVIKVEAKNAGGWAGRRQTWVLDIDTLATDVNETSIDLPIAFSVKEDQLKGGTIKLTDGSTAWKIKSNAASDGVAKTTVTLYPDATAKTDLGVGTDQECTIKVSQTDSWNRDKNLAVKVMDGKEKPSSEWGLYVYVDGELVREYPNLSSDPDDPNYFKDLINNDGGNYYIKVTDNWTGSISASIRPANHYGTVTVATGVTAKSLDISEGLVVADASNAGDNTIADFTLGADVIPDTYTLTYQSGTADWKVESVQQAQHTFPVATGGVVYAADNPYSIGFTITEVTPVDGEYFTVHVLALETDEAIGGRVVFPDETFDPEQGWEITDNDEKSVTLAVGDMTDAGALAGTVNYRLEYKQELRFGYDGIAGVTETHFAPAFNVSSSEFNKLDGKGYGLIKFGTPGVTGLSGVASTTVQKAGAAYAQAKNYQFRYEITKTTESEIAARTYVQDTLGKNTFAKVLWPSWATVADPVLSGRTKDIPTMGMVHGRESKIANDYQGYHKVAAGEDVTLPRIIELPTKEKVLDGEILNPAGIQWIKKVGGNFVVWGARIPTADTEYIFCQHRELMSHYGHVLLNNFDWIIFAINDEQEWPGLIGTLTNYFLPEWRRKRALRGSTFKEACAIKLDAEINDDAAAAAGDLYAELSLKLAETVERFNITLSKTGVTESVS